MADLSLRPAYEPGDGSMDGAQLVDGEWWHPVFGCDSLQMVIDRVRASLAEPELEGPTDEELWEVYDQMDGVAEDWSWTCDYARAVLTRWGCR